MIEIVKNWTKALFHRMGYSVKERNLLNSGELRLANLLRFYQIDLVLDVGANEGQYAQSLRNLGYFGKIVSFEPLSGVFRKLESLALPDGSWTTMNYALGAVDAVSTIRVSDNTECSSFAEVLPRYLETAPRAIVISEEEVQVVRLDNVFEEIVGDSRNVFLKLDVQGYERNVLDGATGSLRQIVGIQLELSLEELYAGELIFDEAVALLKGYGFQLVSLTPVHVDTRTGQVLQMDGVFFRIGLNPNRFER